MCVSQFPVYEVMARLDWREREMGGRDGFMFPDTMESTPYAGLIILPMSICKLHIYCVAATTILLY